jgi:hypothetical protein
MKTTICIFLMVLAFGCTTITTTTKSPEFKDMPALEKRLSDFVVAEKISLDGKEITENKKTISKLEVNITNCKNIPEDDDLKKALTRLLAQEVMNALKDASAFDNYEVKFIQEVQTGGITKKNWISYEMSSRELTSAYMNIGKQTEPFGFVYGGSGFTENDSTIICALRDHVFIDTSDISMKVMRDGQNEIVTESKINIRSFSDQLTYRMGVKEFVNVCGKGKFNFEILSHDTVIATKLFEVQ